MGLMKSHPYKEWRNKYVPLGMRKAITGIPAHEDGNLFRFNLIRSASRR